MDNEEKIICPNCAKLNKKENDFCSECGAPLNPYAAIDPIKRIATYGFIYRKLVSGEINKFVFITTWIVFFPVFIFPFLFVLSYKIYHNDIFLPIGLLYLLFFICIYSRFLFLMTKNYLYHRKDRRVFSCEKKS